MEIHATNGLISDIERVNDIVAEEIKSRNNQEYGTSTSSSQQEAAHEVSIHKENDQEYEVGSGTSTSSSLQEAAREVSTHQEENNPSLDGYKKSDIRFFLKEGTRTSPPTIHCKDTTTKIDDSAPFDKMKVLRGKMQASRQKRENQPASNAILVRKQAGAKPRTWRGERLKYARDAKKEEIHDVLELVVVGADVEALYPSLSDVDVAWICHDAVMKSKVTFSNIDYRKALKYIAISLDKTEQRLSPLYRVLPRRTSKGGVRPGVTSDPDNDENWAFPCQMESLTTLEKKRIVATVVQIGVLTMMGTHVYTFDGKLFLQKAGGLIGLRSTCAVARITMSEWDARWGKIMEDNNVELKGKSRYMDDICNFLYALKA